MATNREIVEHFMAAWPSMDVDRLMAFFDPDAVYTNIPIDPPNRGTAAIRSTMEGFLAMARSCEFVVHNAVADEARGVVMNERTDRFELHDGRWLELPVMGVFELRGGRIVAWRDYFDLAGFQKSLTG
ncbi:MAG: limonene-1,2-epoxide hydrolase family protein [Gammaproteobacteria bacterium]